MMKLCRFTREFFPLLIALTLWLRAEIPSEAEATPADFKVAFIGDQGMGSNAVAVLRLIKSEGAQAVMHLGDFDYHNDPIGWEHQIDRELGRDFPFFACMGNHDKQAWSGEKGYQWYLHERLKRLHIQWDGDFGVKSSFSYKGVFFVLVAPHLKGSDHATYIRQQLAEDKSIWRICGWHENQRTMQVSDKSNEAGWDVYEEAREGGAIIATAHSHVYCRSYLLSSCVDQRIASRSDTLTLMKGTTFVFVSGLSGRAPDQQQVTGAWWAKVYTAQQAASCGALFGTFNAGGEPDNASFYFKNVKGEIIDQFKVRSRVQRPSTHHDSARKLEP